MITSEFWLGFSSGIMLLSLIILAALFIGQAWEERRRGQMAATLLPGPVPEVSAPTVVPPPPPVPVPGRGFEALSPYPRFRQPVRLK